MKFNKILSIVSGLLAFTLLLSGCSLKNKHNQANVQVTGENLSYVVEYDKNLQTYIGELSAILKIFNDSLDKVYTQEYSKSKFASVLKGTINQSNALITSIDELDVHPELFEAHQGLSSLVNRAHQLLLDSIDMANRENREIDKERLREEYVEIKNLQAELNNQWKILRSTLENNEDENEKNAKSWRKG